LLSVGEMDMETDYAAYTPYHHKPIESNWLEWPEP
jgi:hypothetical protein